MVGFDIDGLHAHKMHKNKYGLFKIDSEYREKSDWDIGYIYHLSKWQNGWELVYTCSFSYKPDGYMWDGYGRSRKLLPHYQQKVNELKAQKIEQMIEMSEMMFAPYDKIVKNVDGNIVSFV